MTSQILGVHHAVTAEWRGRALAVVTEEGEVLARGIGDATAVAARALGPGLEAVGRKHTHWGLHVEVAGNEAVYGEWPLLPGPPEGQRRPSRLSRLRARWKPGDSPLEALDNAIQIIREFAERPHARRAA